MRTRTRIAKLSNLTAACIGAAVLAACSDIEPRSSLPAATLASVERIELEEDADDVLGEIGAFEETHDGGFLIADAFRSRLRKYDSHGRLASSFGIHGAGPFEFRRIRGVLALDGDSVLVVDPTLGRVTVLTSSLQPDTQYTQLPRPRGSVLAFGSGMLFMSAPADRATSVALFGNDGQLAWTVPVRVPGPPQQYPYWASTGTTLLASSSTEFITGFSLTYPLLIHDSTGSVVDSIGQPPGFRTASVPELGAFTGPGAAATATEWFDSFDVIAAASVVQDTLLVAARGVIRGESARRTVLHRTLDIYHLPTRTPLTMGIPLQEGSRMLGGGRYLYLLVDQPPNPWTVVRATIVARDDA